MKRVKILRFGFEFFAICTVISLACTFEGPMAAIAMLFFAAVAMVMYLFYIHYSMFSLFSIHYLDKNGKYTTYEISALDSSDALKRARMYNHEIDKVQYVINLGREL